MRPLTRWIPLLLMTAAGCVSSALVGSANDVPPGVDAPARDDASTAADAAAPDAPVTPPDIPIATPDIPPVTPDIPIATPDIPIATPDVPVTPPPDVLAVVPDVPVSPPDVPVVAPDVPTDAVAPARDVACDAPSSETCNGIDDDCDGMIDEGVTRTCYAGPGGTAGVGACRAGTQSCAMGAWESACRGEVLPSTERCDTVDNNCNGVADEGVCP